MDEDTKQNEHSGFYCEVCDCIVKDSLNYLDHTNGKRHNRNLGISLKKFTDSTLEEVKDMLNRKRREREDKELTRTIRDEDFIGNEERDEYLDEEEEEDEDERRRRLKREKKKRQKARRAEL